MDTGTRLDVAYFSYLAARAERDRLLDAYNMTATDESWSAYLKADAEARQAAEVYSAADDGRRAKTAALRAALSAAREAEVIALGIWGAAEVIYNAAGLAVDDARAAVKAATRAAVE